MTRSPLPVPGPDDQWGLQLNAAIESTGVADLADIDYSGGLPDQAAVRYSVVDEKWYPEVSPDMKNFRGDWQDPASTLLWSSDFSNPADLDYVDISGNTLSLNLASQSWTITPTQGTTSAAYGAIPGNPSATFPHMLQNAAITWNGRGNIARIPFSGIPAVAGKYVSKITLRHPTTTPDTNRWWNLDAVETNNFLPATNVWTLGTYAISGIDKTFYMMCRPTSGSDVPGYTFFTDLKIYGAPSTDDLYQIGDVVAYSGLYYRSLEADNDENPTNTDYWIQILNPAKTLSGKLENLADVSTFGRAHGAYLQWDETTHTHKYVMKPDYLNFRGDWQDLTQYLLWGTDFSNPADFDLLTYTNVDTYANNQGRVLTTGATPGNPANTVTGTPPPGLTYSAGLFFYNNSGLATGYNQHSLALGSVPALAGKMVTHIKLWIGRWSSGSGAATVRDIMVGAAVVLTQTALNEAWTELTATVGGVDQTIRVRQSAPSVTSGTNRQLNWTGLRVYGPAPSTELYQVNHVVKYSGGYYRSLYNNNTDLPTNASKWVSIGPAL